MSRSLLAVLPGLPQEIYKYISVVFIDNVTADKISSNTGSFLDLAAVFISELQLQK